MTNVKCWPGEGREEEDEGEGEGSGKKSKAKDRKKNTGAVPPASATPVQPVSNASTAWDCAQHCISPVANRHY